MAAFEDSNNLFVRGKQLFTVNYEAGKGTLPEEQGWNYVDPATMPNQPSVINAKLLQALTEENGAQLWEIFPGSVGNFITDSAIFEIQVKVLESSDHIAAPPSWHTGWEINIIDSNKRGFALGLSESGVRFSNDFTTPMHQIVNSIEIPFNTTDDFHIYRLEISGGTGYVVIDGSGAGSLGFGGVAAAQTADQAWFGDDSNLASGQTELIYIHTDVMSQEFHQDNLGLYAVSTITLPASGDLMISGKGSLAASGNLVTPNTFDVSQSSGTLWVQGIILSSGGLDLVIPETKAIITSNIPLFMSPFIVSSGDLDLYLNGVVVEPPPTGDLEGKFIDEYCRTSDFIPTLMGQFTLTSPSGVTIAVWDIIGGDNTELVLASSGAQQVGDTESWFWSMSNMPSDKSADGYFLFRMIADTGEIIEKEVVIVTSANGAWKYP